MGKRKSVNRSVKQVDQEIDEEPDPENEDFFYDDVDKFHHNRESDLLGHGDSDDSMFDDDDEEEVLSIDGAEVENDSESEMDDDEGDGIPSSKAWGRKKSMYYGGESLEGLQGFDRDAVQDEEEEEALKIQRRLAEEIDEDQLDAFPISKPAPSDWNKESDSTENTVATDVSHLSTKAQWKLLKKESPELKELMNDFKEKSNVLQSQLCPLMKLVRLNRIEQNGAVYVKTRYKLYLTYLMNISFYMALKMKRISVHNHPVVKRLVEYRTLINKLDPVDERLQEEIDQLLLESNLPTERNDSLEDVAESEELDDEALCEEEDDTDDQDDDDNSMSDDEPPKKTSRGEAIKYYTALQDKLKRVAEKESEKKPDSAEAADDSERRAINYTISKNQGLKGKKRKIDRNPRVKHKERFRKALIKRKSQVRIYRPELQKYSGEASGIRAGVVRGVRIR